MSLIYHHKSVASVLAALVLLICGIRPVSAQDWELVWFDEFEGTEVDQSKWEYMIGDGCTFGICGWGNNELQWYRAENATIENGSLVITAREESYSGKSYTSSRLRTLNKGDWTYGRFVIRARLPKGQGIWPAIWMLPSDEEYGGWAASGEIDIMELVGHEPDKIHGTIFYGGSWPAQVSSSSTYTLPSGDFSDDFHIFTLEWEPAEMRWYVDGERYATKTSWWSSGGDFPAPFDKRFHLLMNVAVGGNWPGNPDVTTVFPQRMEIDYVRVYESPGGSTPSSDLIFDDMEHGDPMGNSWFTFGGSAGGGEINVNNTDLPPSNGGSYAIEAGYGGNAGFLGGFGRTRPMDLSAATHFNFWLNPDAGQSYTLEVNFQDDDNGNNSIPGTPVGDDDEFQYDCVVGPSGPCAISGGGWQLVSIAFDDLFDDNGYLFGGNGVFDPVPASEGGNGALINVVFAVIGTGTDVNFRTDYWIFTNGPLTTDTEYGINALPEGYRLGEAYPNPFNPSAQFELTIARTQNVEIDLYNMLGQPVAELYNGIMIGRTTQVVTINGSRIPSGTYVYRIKGEDFLASRSVVLLK